MKASVPSLHSLSDSPRWKTPQSQQGGGWGRRHSTHRVTPHEQRDFTRVSFAQQNLERTVPSDALPHFHVSTPFPAVDTKPYRKPAAAQIIGRQATAPELTSVHDPLPRFVSLPPHSSFSPFVLSLHTFPSSLASLHPFLLPLGCFHICCPPFTGVFIYRLALGSA